MLYNERQIQIFQKQMQNANIHLPSNNEIIGFGDKVVKITDQETGEVVAYFGIQDEKEKVYFSKPISIEGLEAVHELLQKKKFNKHIANERFDKAQNFANRKF